ncbi:MAG: hypothetical protein JWM21_3179 [Acidobacteria bacterium]|nr:hypothetical protein [Acidobacteriota bacterium]
MAFNLNSLVGISLVRTKELEILRAAEVSVALVLYLAWYPSIAESVGCDLHSVGTVKTFGRCLKLCLIKPS